MQIVSRIK